MSENKTPLPGVGAPEEGHSSDLGSSEDTPIDTNAQATSRVKTNRLHVTPFHKITPRLSGAYLVKGVIPCDGFGVIYGPPGSGKSFLAVSLGLHLAAGRPWFDRLTRQTGVLYVALEGEAGMHNRVSAARRQLELPRDTPFSLACGSADLRRDLESVKEIVRLAQQFKRVTGYKCGLVIIDTLARAMGGGKENEAQDMGFLLANAGRIREALGCTVLMIHHPSRQGEGNPRGHSSLDGAADFLVAVSREAGTDQRIFCIHKQKDGQDGERIGFTLERVELGSDEDGETVTTCIVRETDAPPQEAKGKRRLTDSSTLALEALRKAISADGRLAPSSNHIPAGKLVVTLKTWRGYCDQLGVTKSELADSRLKAFDRATANLQRHGIVGTWGDYAWIV